MWAGQANALPAASAFLPLLNFSLQQTMNFRAPMNPAIATNSRSRCGKCGRLRNLLNFEFGPADTEPMNDWMGEAMKKRDWQFFIGGLVVGILLGVILTGLWR